MGFDQIIDHCPDIVNAQFGTGVGVKHSCLINVVLLARQSRVNSDLVDTDLTHIQRCELVRQCADVTRLDTAFIGETGHFNAAVRREIVNQAGIHDIAAEGEGLAGFDCFNNAGRILVASGMGQVFIMNQLLSLRFPHFCLCDTAAGVLIQRDVVTLD